MKNILKNGLMIFNTLLFICFLLVALSSRSGAETIVVGDGIRFSPANPHPGETLFADVMFHIESSLRDAIPINFSMIDVAETPNADRPTLSGQVYTPGHPVTIRVAHFIPNPAPIRKCFNVYAHFPGTPLRSVPLIQNACVNARLRLVNAGTGHSVSEAYRSSDEPGAPTIIKGTVIGRNVSFSPTNLDPIESLASWDRNLLRLGLNIDYTGAALTGCTLSLKLDGYDTSSWSSWGLNPGHNLIYVPESIHNSLRSVFIPARLGFSAEIAFPAVSSLRDLRSSFYPLITGIQIETVFYALSNGTGQRITLPTAQRALPRTGMQPVQPHFP
jgi:hypothetical protein